LGERVEERKVPAAGHTVRLDSRLALAWLLHWGTVALVLLAFVMPFAQFLSQHSQKPIHFWHELHITVGTAALIFALVRLALVWVPRRGVAAASSVRGFAPILQLVLLGMIVAIAFSGLLAFGQPVLGTKMKFLGLWTFPELRSLVSARSSQFRPYHWLLSYGFLAFLALHIWIGVRRDARGNRLLWKKLWPW
jgi:cytochrome b561